MVGGLNTLVYISEMRADGLPADHLRARGRVVKIAPYSMTIIGSIADWSTWIGATLDQSGETPSTSEVCCAFCCPTALPAASENPRISDAVVTAMVLKRFIVLSHPSNFDDGKLCLSTEETYD
jgi:hypothetical protein